MRGAHKSGAESHNHVHVGALLISLTAFFVMNSAIAVGQKVTKTSVELAPLTVRLTPEPATIVSCVDPRRSSNSRVQLSAETNSPSGHQLRYGWSTTGGNIVGEGSSVIWDLTGVQPGSYKAFVTTYTGSGEEECEAFSSTTVLVSPCGPPPPVCPAVSIACPQDLATGMPLVFSATLTGGSTDKKPIFNWVVSNGQIVEGQGTSSIKVDNTGLGGQSVTATLGLGGYNLDCSASCTVSIPLPTAPSRKFDEFADISRNDEKARLDNFAIELQNDPGATAYVIVYPSRRGGNVEAQRRSSRIVDYLVNTRAVDSHRIVTLQGPARNDLQIELWTVPPGSRPPTVPED